MSVEELSTMTVIELRKLAREMGVPLSAGISKAGIVERLFHAMEANKPKDTTDSEKVEASPTEAVQTTMELELPLAPAPAPAPAPAQAASVPVQPAPQAKPAAPANAAPVQFKAAWHNPQPRNTAPRMTPSAPRQGTAWDRGGTRTLQQDPVPRANTRPVSYTRFGPGAPSQEAQESKGGEEEYRGFRQNEAAPRARRPFTGEQGSSYGETPRPAFNSRPAQESFTPVENTQPISPAELLTPAQCPEACGFLEAHPEGYGFLRADTMLPSSKDIYIGASLIRRYGLRSGDRVAGRVRPQREGDKFAAMLYVTSVNDIPTDELSIRPTFDEMTAAYPEQRINLNSSAQGRLVDLLAPIGYGQRVLLLCPPETGKVQFMTALANTIRDGNPDTEVLYLLIEEMPEDVALIRQRAHVQVLTSTFDMAPDNHLRLADLVLERAERLAEQGKNVVLLVDSLTRLCKIFTNAAAAQGRSIPGMVNPSSLYRAKRLFGAARRLAQGGSLTVIGAMNVDNGSRVDDTVMEQFRAIATTLLTLDVELMSEGVVPALQPKGCYTKKAELFSSPEQMEGSTNIATHVVGMLPAAQAIEQLQSFIAKTADNTQLLARLKDWVALASDAR